MPLDLVRDEAEELGRHGRLVRRRVQRPQDVLAHLAELALAVGLELAQVLRRADAPALREDRPVELKDAARRHVRALRGVEGVPAQDALAHLGRGVRGRHKEIEQHLAPRADESVAGLGARERCLARLLAELEACV